MDFLFEGKATKFGVVHVTSLGTSTSSTAPQFHINYIEKL